MQFKHYVLNPPKHIKKIITLLVHMDVLIQERMKQGLRFFEYYRIVVVVPWL